MNDPLEKGVITKKCKRPTSYEVKLKNSDSVIERNRHHIIPYRDKFIVNDDTTESQPNEKNVQEEIYSKS